ncbi:MAG: nucleotidyltransferase domain-containing protein [Mariprofundales bacterium]
MNNETLAQIVSTIVRVSAPEQIILFGSHARVDAGPESDLDLLVVESGTFDQNRSRRSELTRLWKALAHFMVAKDILLYNQKEVEKWRGSVNHVIANALREGKVLYERH